MDITRWVERNIGSPLLVLHNKLYKGTNGRIGHRIPVPGIAPALLLHTVGAKTGQPRTTSLSYFRDGDDYLVVASKGGNPRAPGWYHNLKARPDVEINVGTKRYAVTAAPVLPGDPRYPELWRNVNEHNHHVYEGYQKRTSRPIPVVRLTPKS
ncbi:nitroreductase family deazaflavin-dependent oxidoreductase [Mycobacterium sp. Y57]|uniref:nitroreductase family deazaflavin-dependent oxidoreductase n=1 Tax=Mycolicibacterium xanthum TaxID=2796469 RepID=UPI001C853CEE|nr:nitroreductase family deazaflavin-dependent oxidoreductase [Mycolicibacterium xanthum]MBX7432450.1 nitroreductase family deazaflavin-dependent oxidoreductase [Mycolicibacterium xanthum]